LSAPTATLQLGAPITGAPVTLIIQPLLTGFYYFVQWAAPSTQTNTRIFANTISTCPPGSDITIAREGVYKITWHLQIFVPDFLPVDTTTQAPVTLEWHKTGPMTTPTVCQLIGIEESKIGIYSPGYYVISGTFCAHIDNGTKLKLAVISQLPQQVTITIRPFQAINVFIERLE
jgi:hypothetical protein